MTDYPDAVRELDEWVDAMREDDFEFDRLGLDAFVENYDAAVAALEAEVARLNKINTSHYQEAQVEHALRLSAEAEARKWEWVARDSAEAVIENYRGGTSALTVEEVIDGVLARYKAERDA